MILKINDRIRNRKVEFFNKFSLSLRYDAIASSFSFDFYFNPENIEHVELACIGHYHLATLEHNGELLLTGYILSEGFSDSARKELTTFGGYSLPGVLEDCEIPTSLYPLQSDGLSLREIAQKLIQPFGLSMVVDPSVSAKMDSVYDTSTANEKQSIKGYLSELASQKNIIITNNENGQIVFTSAKTDSKPILNFDKSDGAIPFTSMRLSFSGQPMHSHITVVKQADAEGGNAGEITIRNPFVPFVYRPTVKVQSSGDDNDTELAAKTALADELKNIKLTIVTDRWEIDGKVIKPNQVISVQNPDVYLFKKTKWFIESVNLDGDNKATTATLNCVLPEVYNGQIPEYIFEGINIHG